VLIASPVKLRVSFSVRVLIATMLLTCFAAASNNLVLRWNDALLQGIRDSRLGPPMVARALAISNTCMYDAWAAYDSKAKGTRLNGSLRRPASERTDANKQKAISFAAYRAAVDLLPGGKASVFDPLMESLGYDAADITTDVRTPAGVATSHAPLCWNFVITTDRTSSAIWEAAAFRIPIGLGTKLLIHRAPCRWCHRP
jgi:Domain of unknown function (DUF6851)